MSSLCLLLWKWWLLGGKQYVRIVSLWGIKKKKKARWCLNKMVGIPRLYNLCCQISWVPKENATSVYENKPSESDWFFRIQKVENQWINPRFLKITQGQMSNINLTTSAEWPSNRYKSRSVEKQLWLQWFLLIKIHHCMRSFACIRLLWNVRKAKSCFQII